MLGSLLAEQWNLQVKLLFSKEENSNPTVEWVVEGWRKVQDRYFQDVEDDVKKISSEGIVGRVPYKRIKRKYATIHWWSSRRNGIWFKDVSTLQETGRFVRTTASGINESHPHNVTITKEAP
jgi:IMP dehydrogenase/GMP reductase